MSNIPTSTKPNLTEALLPIDNGTYTLRQFVIFASSQSVGLDGAPLQQIPLDIVEDDDDGTALARALVATSENYTAEDGWLIEYRDAETVSFGDMQLLAERLGDEWDEYIGVECQTCGDTGIVEICGDVDGACVTMQGDCPGCSTDVR